MTARAEDTGRRLAFAGLLDDAAIFPPASAAMADAVAAHVAMRKGPDAGVVGPFVCSLERLAECESALAEIDARLAIALTVPAGADPSVLDEPLSRRAGGTERRAGVRTLEAAVGLEDPDRAARLDALAALVDATGLDAVAVEFDALPDERALAELGRRRLRAKFRTGGLVASAFPSEQALAEAIRSAIAGGASFKCTAGLHRAVRHRSADGLEHHGFLNVFLAAYAAMTGGTRAEVTDLLAERDEGAIVDQLRALTVPELTATREIFVSFGTCSVDEPLEHLRRLALY